MSDILALLQPHLPADVLAQACATARPSIPYRLSVAADLPLTASRVGGIGYWPQAQPYPVNPEGLPLALLAQVNLEELPAGAAQALGLPAHGILAFYIDAYDDVLGQDFDDLRGNSRYRCVYFADTAVPSLARAAQQALFDQVQGEEWYHPAAGEYAMHFAPPAPHYLLTETADFAALYGMEYGQWLNCYDSDVINPAFTQQGTSHLGGHAFFTQTDPRFYDSNLATSALLFQLDSYVGEGVDICWGDIGVGAFFIDPADFAARRFERAWYNWDCG